MQASTRVSYMIVFVTMDGATPTPITVTVTHRNTVCIPMRAPQWRQRGEMVEKTTLLYISGAHQAICSETTNNKQQIVTI